jgi:hypothetical protein
MFGELVGSRFMIATCRSPVKSAGSGVSQPYRKVNGAAGSARASSRSRRASSLDRNVYRLR